MNGAGTEPHPPKKIVCSSMEGPWRETDGARSLGSDPSIVFFFQVRKKIKAMCPKGAESNERESRGNGNKPGLQS